MTILPKVASTLTVSVAVPLAIATRCLVCAAVKVSVEAVAVSAGLNDTIANVGASSGYLGRTVFTADLSPLQLETSISYNFI